METSCASSETKRSVPQRCAASAELEARTNQAMLRYVAGDDRAFDELYVLLAPRLRRLCSRLTDPAEADDICQETFIKIHRARGAYNDCGHVSTWAFIIARRTLLDRLRYQRRRPELGLDQAPLAAQRAPHAYCPESSLQQRRSESALERELCHLPDNLRAAYELVQLHGLNYGEAGALLDTTHAAVKQRLHRARRQLSVALHEWVC